MKDDDRVIRKEIIRKFNNFRLRILREFDGTYVKDIINLTYSNREFSFGSFFKFFKFMSRYSAIYRLVSNILDREDLCIRCGYCCTTGCPPISIDDSLRICNSEFRYYVYEVLSNTVNFRINSHIDLFIVWNAALDILKPCPFLRYDKYASCSIYPVRPEICRIFKCWSPLTDYRRRSHIMKILGELQEVNVDSNLEKLRSIAISNLGRICSYLF